MNGHTYRKLPADFPVISKAFRARLWNAKRCSNCADCNPFIATHMWKQCPYAPHPARQDYVYPVTNSPMAITASRQLQTFPIRVFSEPLPSDAVVPEYCATHEDDVFCDDSSPPSCSDPIQSFICWAHIVLQSWSPASHSDQQSY